jgi:hypothetical protein
MVDERLGHAADKVEALTEKAGWPARQGGGAGQDRRGAGPLIEAIRDAAAQARRMSIPKAGCACARSTCSFCAFSRKWPRAGRNRWPICAAIWPS